MKKITSLLLSLVLVFALLAGCGSSKPAASDFTWTRTGTFEDADGNYLLLAASEDEDAPGWSVTFMAAEGNMFGNVLTQEGETLHGNLDYEEENAFIVTISEEGEDGLLLEAESGESYHFTPVAVPDAKVFVTINTEGMGQITYAPEGETLEFDDEYPAQSAQLNLEGPATYVFGAKADDGWKFVKWTKDGADFSTDEQITVDLTEGEAEFIAVFEGE